MVYTVTNFVAKQLSDFKGNDQLKVLVPPNDSRFAIVKTLHNSKGLDNDTARWTRSVVWDTKTELPVSVSPPKSSSEPFPMNGWTLLQEHVDGVMINAFRVSNDKVHITTRSYLGATNRFNGIKDTFADLFYATMTSAELEELVGPLTNEASRFTSLVLVHPSIRQVVPVTEARVYVVHQGTVAADGTVSIEENPENWTTAASALAPRNLSIPSFPNEESLKNFVDTKTTAFQWKWQGMSAKNSEGQRWRYTTDLYRKARSLKGNESDNVERFLRLRRARAVQSYLKFYNEDTDAFWALESKLRTVTHEVFSEYCLKNKAKSKTLQEVPPAYRVHVYGLHSLFISTLKPHNKTLQKEHVVEYFNTQAIERVAHLLRVGGGSDTTRPMPGLIPISEPVPT